MRALLLIPLLLCTACDGDLDKPGKQAGPKTAPKKSVRRAPEAPATGITRIQESHDMWAKLLAGEESKTKPDRRTVEQVIRGCDTLIKALTISIREDAKFAAKIRHAEMRRALARLGEQRSVMLREAQEIESILKEAASGVAPIPSGFTRAELEDNLADVREEMRKLDGRLKKHLEGMAKLEQALAAGETPEPEETLASRELDTVRALRKKAEGLLR